MATEFNLEITPILPKSLQRLEELADDLWYGWNVPTRALFEQLDYELWIRVGHNPKLFLRNVDQRRLEQASKDPLFLSDYQRVLTDYENYRADKTAREQGKALKDNDLIAYFCAEYGFHESLPVYSGGLGILAGDHCKTASDLRLPFIAVGLYYQLGYFSQLIDGEGNQLVSNCTHETEHLALTAVQDENGQDIIVQVHMADHDVYVRAWKAKVGHITLYLLDSNLDQNRPEDREITYQLYGGGEDMRIRQEMLLGIGGVRMLRQLDLSPTVWHMNEGHAAFLVLERLRERIHSGQAFNHAMEYVAASSVFTTHTPVPAGHDHFPEHLIRHYLGGFAHELGLSWEKFMELGRLPNDGPDFNMTTLAVHGSRKMNGVSRIHGDVSSEICQKFWPNLEPEENPMTYVTNGVHVASFLARQWSELFDKHLGAGWNESLCDAKFWEKIEKIPDQEFWETRRQVKSRMLEVVRNVLISQHRRNQASETHLENILRHIDPKNPNILTIGFARRFATYKRATLLFNDIDRLRRILSNEDRPVVFIFAGKAHPADKPGQALLRHIHQLSNEPEFIGKILLVQGYDMGLSRRLVSGVDVWLNNPVYPLEASGTSGMKAAINGAPNLSILDGWWAEGFEGDNGWGIRPSPHEDAGRRDHDDARSLYDTLENELIPLYYHHGQYGYSPEWVQIAKRSIISVLPRFNMVRVLNDYLTKLYIPASENGKRLSADNYEKTRFLADWKSKVKDTWHGISIRLVSAPTKTLSYDQAATIEVAVRLNGLEPNDVAIELLLAPKLYHPEIVVPQHHHDPHQKASWSSGDKSTISYRLEPVHGLDHGEFLYRLEFQPDLCGDLSYRIRIFPFHELLTDPHEMGLMNWA